MRDDQCIFCKIANGEIPSATLYEDDSFRVILDLSPASRGHALILPKEHFRNLFDLPETYSARVLPVAQKVGQKLVEGLHADGMNLVQNNEACAGQSVFHFHAHLIPRFEGDHALGLWEPGELTEETKQDILSIFA